MSEPSGSISNNAHLESSAEPSMEEVLASIRRILKEEEAAPAKHGGEDDVLLLDETMRVTPVDLSATQAPAAAPSVAEPPEPRAVANFSSSPAIDLPKMQSEPAGPVLTGGLDLPRGLMGEEASAAAANSIGALVRSVSAERAAAVSRGGTTIEDIVREEVKPVLKAWLDTHLPGMVERMVRAEIARLVDRGTG